MNAITWDEAVARLRGLTELLEDGEIHRLKRESRILTETVVLLSRLLVPEPAS